MTTRLLRCLILGIFVAAGAAKPAGAAVLQVANNGVDADGCGTKAAPCRSITRALDAAAAGDTIVVGPGHYGDLDGDGATGGTGEEGPETLALIRVDKAVTIVSSAGAAATIIRGAGNFNTIVRITASGARFGKPKKGFTLFVGKAGGVVVEGSAANVVVEGNTGLGNSGNAFSVSGAGAGNLLQGNVAVANAGGGFALAGTGGAVARGNLAVANTGNGFNLGGSGQRCEGNVATGNVGDGYQAALYVDATLVGNVAVGNAQGVAAGGGDELTVSGLAAIGNVIAGVHNQNTTTMTVTASNLLGNGAQAIGGALNCGAANESNTLAATTVFWGAATGPGDDPADDVCDLLGQATTVDPIATKPFKIKTKVPQL